MALVPMKELLINARKKGIGLGGFMPWNYDSAYAIAEVSKKYDLPAIFICGSAPPSDMGGFHAVTDMAANIACQLDMDICVHADHFQSYDMLIQAIQGGYTSVMIDASRFPIEENIRRTKDIVMVAHACGVSVEAEIGRLPGNEGDEEVTVADAFQTDPDEAAYFVDQTGIDALAVSIGTMHGAYPAGFKPEINIKRLKEIAAKVSIPLVLHGGSGTPDDKVAESIKHGVAKINIATDLVTAYAHRIYEIQANNPGLRYGTNLFAEAKAAVACKVEEKIRLFAGIK